MGVLIYTKAQRLAQALSVLLKNDTTQPGEAAALNAFITLYALTTLDPTTFGTDMTGKAGASDVSITASSAVLTSPSNPWTAADVGKEIYVQGAGLSGGTLRTSIAGFTNAGSVTLATVAKTTVAASSSGASGIAVWGTAPSTSQQVFNVRDFGAVGDGVTNDTDAFQAASAKLVAAGGGTLHVPPGTYVVGRQVFAGGTGKGYAYQGQGVITITGLSRGVKITGHGATLKLASGLKYGSFDPTTGAAAGSSSAADNAASVVALGFIVVTGCTGAVVIEGFEIDGNMATVSLGGSWGGTGYQIDSSGIYLNNNAQATVRDCYVHHCELDGVYARRDSALATDADTPVLLHNVRCEYNARQGLSWVGGNGLTAIACKFNHTGQATFGSAPKAGVDVEPNGGTVCRRGRFIGCEFLNNAGVGFNAANGDSADITLHACVLWGTVSHALWPQMPRMRFLGCRIFGSTINVYGSTTSPQDAAVFDGCTFSDEVHPTFGTYVPLYTVNAGSVSAAGVQMLNCTFIGLTHRPLNLAGSQTNPEARARLQNCTIISQNSGETDGNPQVVLWGVDVGGLRVLENYSSPPATGYRIDVAAVGFFGDVYLATVKLKWASASSGSVGRISTVPVLTDSFTTDIASVATGADLAIGTRTVTGANLGDSVEVTCSIDVIGLRLWGYVSAAGTVKVRATNTSGGAIDLASATYYVTVRPRAAA